MDIILLSKVIGILFILSGVSAMLNTKFLKDMMKQISKENLALFMSALIETTLGLLIVFHLDFTSVPAIIISIFGIIMTIEGTLLLIFPTQLQKLSRKVRVFMNYSPVFGIIYALLGLYLVFFGFGLI